MNKTFNKELFDALLRIKEPKQGCRNCKESGYVTNEMCDVCLIKFWIKIIEEL